MSKIKRIKILKGCHYPLKLVPAIFNYLGFSKKNQKYTISKNILFEGNCRYHIEGNDQYDWSKLFGFKFGINGIHKNSIRFGWRYNPKTDNIEICYLIYTNNGATHMMTKIGEVGVGFTHKYTITYEIKDEISIEFRLDNEKFEISIPNPKTRFHYGSGFYFGGNQVAPQEVSILTD